MDGRVVLQSTAEASNRRNKDWPLIFVYIQKVMSDS